MNLSRRSLLTGFAGLLAAPAIVRASSLMPIKVFTAPVVDEPFVYDSPNYVGYWIMKDGRTWWLPKNGKPRLLTRTPPMPVAWGA